ncbi:hypothetical protein D9M68_594430 [compost metagenome]
MRQRVQEQGRAAHARRRDRTDAFAAGHSSGARHGRRRARRDPQGRRRREVLGAGIQAHDRPLRRPADLRARVLGRSEQGRHRLQPGQGQERAYRPYRADARQRTSRNRRNPCRRHRRLRGPEGRHHGRNPVRPERHDHAGAHGIPRARDLAGRRAQDQGRPGKDGHRPSAPGFGRSVVPRAQRRRIRSDHHFGHGRTAPRNHRGPHEARIRRGSQRGQAASGLPRNDPQDRRRSRRQVRSPVGW